MDRTVILNDLWSIDSGIKAPSGNFLKKKESLQVKSSSPFTVKRKVIMPKQVNDKVWAGFSGEYKFYRFYAGKNLVHPETDEEGRTVFDITPFLKTGITHITAIFECGEVKEFFLTIKRIN